MLEMLKELGGTAQTVQDLQSIDGKELMAVSLAFHLRPSAEDMTAPRVISLGILAGYPEGTFDRELWDTFEPIFEEVREEFCNALNAKIDGHLQAIKQNQI